MGPHNRTHQQRKSVNASESNNSDVLKVNYWGEWTWQWISLQHQTTQQSQFTALILYINMI
jgi:hypothetical protein